MAQLPRQPFNTSYVTKQLLEVDKHLSRRLSAYFIGGCALSLRNLKEVTFDIDVVLDDNHDFKEIFSALEKAGYHKPPEMSGEHKLLYTHEQVENKDGLHFDLFVERVCKMLKISEAMKGRADEFEAGTYRNLRVFLISPEDIFLFKGFASEGRTRDLDDMEMLVYKNLNWKTIEDECLAQAQNHPIWEEKHWLSFFIDRLDELERIKGIQTPIRQRLAKLLEK